MQGKTIVGIATPAGNGGVGIVRLSGTRSLEIAKKMFDGEIKVGLNVGSVLNDTCVLLYFRSPNSFTGDDVVEFQCHGGYFLLQRVVDTALTYGAVLAEAGEFSRTAFLNGKMSLDQAESIIDIIHAETDLQLDNAGKIYSGALKEKLDNIEKQLIDILAQIEATLDYPDEVGLPDDLAQNVKNISCQISGLVNTARTGKIISTGINVAVLGKPNVGKSSVFNALLNNERSIVTDIAGTTTDIVTESIHYKGIKINFFDTAGIRDADGKIEKLGIERTKKTARECDLVLNILDATSDEKPIATNNPNIVVYNKSDLKQRDGFMVSAKTGYNIEKIKEEIYKKVFTVPIKATGVIITNTRHLNELTLALQSLEIDFDDPLDCIASNLQITVNHIGNITGTRATDAVLDAVFSRFCLGK